MVPKIESVEDEATRIGKRYAAEYERIADEIEEQERQWIKENDGPEGFEVADTHIDLDPFDVRADEAHIGNSYISDNDDPMLEPAAIAGDDVEIPKMIAIFKKRK